MRFKKIYLEITNVCNLHCSFCHGTARPPRFLSPAEFEIVLGIRSWDDYEIDEIV